MNTSTNAGPLTLIGCGDAFEAIADEPAAYGLVEAPQLRRIEAVAAIAASAYAVLDALIDDAGDAPLVFIAVEAHALNYARLELYGRAKLRGVRMATLVHESAVVAASAKLSDNCLVGPAALIGSGATIGPDSFIGAGARLEAGVMIAAHVWVGCGASLGAGCNVGTHSIVGADVKLRPGISLGRHCVIDSAGEYDGCLRAGSFNEPIFGGVATIVGAGYTFQVRD